MVRRWKQSLSSFSQWYKSEDKTWGCVISEIRAQFRAGLWAPCHVVSLWSSEGFAQVLDSVNFCISPVWGSFKLLFILIAFQPYSVSPVFLGLKRYERGLLVLSCRSLKLWWLCHLFFLLLRLGEVYWPVLKFTGSVLCHFYLRPSSKFKTLSVMAFYSFVLPRA